MSHRLAAIAPVSGSFMNGYIQTPKHPLPVISVTGVADLTVPANATFNGKPLSYEGWIYSLVSDIFAAWEYANGCTAYDMPNHYATSFDGVHRLYCWGKICAAKTPVIRCAWLGAHNYFGNSGAYNGALIWEFLSKFSNPLHQGLGETAVNPERSSKLSSPASIAIRLPADYNSTNTIFRKNLRYNISTTGRFAPSIQYYGHPNAGCKLLESNVSFTIDENTTGSTCAPTMPVATCQIGGYRTKSNGCPPPPNKKLFTTCLAIEADATPSALVAHCFLACDRNNTKASGDIIADGECPRGASCVPGFLRFGHVGICLYVNSTGGT
eukprot:CAMPEP_0170197600 /NCGR_PEP_ID=MMETSP0040_2-20121228/66750_1 /TAXON_ID=641309 /ORGANISM="Lotharella oceanica, Strain CCMP622" /LENGTH=324 /DNA_ID=CAMNT_0010447307 /DNA_START=318 /DNA_END=1292 /DNA_ORIENTATION=-